MAGRAPRVLREKRLQRRELSGRVAGAERAVELDACLHRRWKRLPGVELQRTREPGADGSRQRLDTSAGGQCPRALGKSANFIGIFLDLERTAQDERERDRPELHDVASLIEARGASRLQQRDTQLLPQLVVRKMELLERGTEHVVGHDQPAARHDDDVLRRDGAVCEARHLLVKQGHRWHELTDQTERGVDLEGEQLLLRDGKKLGQPNPWNAVGDDPELLGIGPDPEHGADARERGVLE